MDYKQIKTNLNNSQWKQVAVDYYTLRIKDFTIHLQPTTPSAYQLKIYLQRQCIFYDCNHILPQQNKPTPEIMRQQAKKQAINYLELLRKHLNHTLPITS